MLRPIVELGQVWKSTRKNHWFIYVLVKDYEKVRPVIIAQSNKKTKYPTTNTAFTRCPFVDLLRGPFYHGDELVADSLEQYYTKDLKRRDRTTWV